MWGPDSGFIDVMTDTDDDGVADFLERASGDVDRDGDGIFDHEDSDDDGDGIPTGDELNRDSDSDGIADYLDPDDDNDGTSTKDELAKAGSPTKDSDSDGVPDYLDDDRKPDDQEPQDGGMVEECAQSEAKADLRKKPVDIVFVIDNSSSMASEIQAVQKSVNDAFATIIGMSGIDYRVIMLADFGYFEADPNAVQKAWSVCINGALNPDQSCPASRSDAVYAQAPKQSARYFHYDADGPAHFQKTSVDSKNSLCRALEWFKKPDGFNLAPEGWGKWLRKDANKVFVEITDDQASCSADLDGDGTNEFVIDDTKDDPSVTGDVPGEWQAKTFDNALRSLSNEHFGSDTVRNYVFHSIIAMPYKMDMPEVPYEASEPITGMKCASGSNPGRGYEALSRLTGGLRFPVCAADMAAMAGNIPGFDAVFGKIAQGVVEGSKVACDFVVPEAPAGQTLNRDTVEVVYSPSTGAAISFRKVADSESCAAQDGSFYFNGNKIQLCADTCGRVQADNKAKVDVRFGCTLPPRVPPPPPPITPPQSPE